MRSRHDELYFEVVDPHFTLVFPVFICEESVFIHHVKHIAQAIQPFDFVLRCAVLGDDAFNDYTHVFLAPDEGFSHVVKLHDRLYTGLLEDELRLDIPFIPHIGIANSLDPLDCKDVIDEINATPLEIRGRVETLDIIWYENNRVGTIEQIILV